VMHLATSATRLSHSARDPCLHAVVPTKGSRPACRQTGVSAYKHSRMLYHVLARRRGFPSPPHDGFGFIGL
jgi:hypothetical protein